MRAAFFDIDGVLTKGFAVFGFWNHLAQNNIINAEHVMANKKIFDKYRKGKISYREMAVKGMNHVATAFKGSSQKEIKKISKEFLLNNRIETFHYTIPLIKLLKGTKIKVIAISGSNIEFIENYKSLLGLDHIYGTEFETINGVYTGSVKLHLGLAESKKIIMQDFSGKMNRFIGFGDTDQDAPILENVKFPIAINPSKKLNSMALKRGWTILTEKDNVIEEVKKFLVSE
jgi:HAD superfamily phosphoserine phosphatase-like hydrolase